MPNPHLCGWPDATNTGTHGTLTLVQGSVTLSTAGMVYENRDVRGCISVRAKNVTIRNVKVTCSATYAIGINSGTGGDIWWDPAANLLVEDVEINHAGQLEGKGIAFTGYTARRVWYHGGSDCMHFGVNVLIEDSFCDIIAGGPADGPHYDALQSDGGSNITIRHNTLRVPYSQTSAILMSTNTSRIADVWILDNLMAGGGYTAYCGTAVGPVQGTFVFMGNRVARTYFPNGGFWGPLAYCDGRTGPGNVWDDTGSAL